MYWGDYTCSSDKVAPKHKLLQMQILIQLLCSGFYFTTHDVFI